ncbi:MAG: YlxM family DNA-binding protein [Lachnospiraceae bacterium]|jgi:predicted DNA-binding protein YlxM (UPF0122 family)|nr:YlxM family DNA-binding protein [Lachnospiraceae bacterium]MCX4315507.1 YlxM family DNA-binding protein [Lachnospiraceae bacterium]
MEKQQSPVEKRVELSMLYDFYGELLKENQRQIFEDYIQNDYSLAEIAEEHGISRQGIHDTVRRCMRQLEDYEERLHLAARFAEAKEILKQIRELTETDSRQEAALQEIRRLSGHLLELW